MIRAEEMTKQELADWNNKFGTGPLDLNRIGNSRLNIETFPCELTGRINFLTTIGHKVLGYKVERKANNNDILTLVTNQGSDTYTGTFKVNGFIETLNQMGYVEL